MDNDEISRKLFSETRQNIPSADEIVAQAMDRIFKDIKGDKEKIKATFSYLVTDIQLIAYQLYQDFEAQAAGKAIRNVIAPMLPANATANDLFDFIEERFPILDRFYLSLTQSRRPRAGRTFESVVSELFKTLEYPYTSQPDLGESRPDYVLPSIDWYKKYSADCIIFTCKRTLRERWRQVITEGLTGQSFYLATIDKNLSDGELKRMKDRRVIVVVPEEIRQEKYEGKLNVISFENFFEQHLDPAIERWRSKGVI